LVDLCAVSLSRHNLLRRALKPSRNKKSQALLPGLELPLETKNSQSVSGNVSVIEFVVQADAYSVAVQLRRGAEDAEGGVESVTAEVGSATLAIQREGLSTENKRMLIVAPSRASHPDAICVRMYCQ
jgi:hypothetical protein